jgi:hypothetical protein
MNKITPMQMIKKMIITKGPAIIGQYGSLQPMMVSPATTRQHARTEREGIDPDQANGVRALVTGQS